MASVDTRKCNGRVLGFPVHRNWMVLFGGACASTPRSPSQVPFYRFLPYEHRLQKKVGTLILTSLLEDLETPRDGMHRFLMFFGMPGA